MGFINTSTLIATAQRPVMFNLDGGTTNFVVNDHKLFSYLDTSSTAPFNTANGECRSSGTGTVFYEVKDITSGQLIVLEFNDVAYMPAAADNLISTGLLELQDIWEDKRNQRLYSPSKNLSFKIDKIGVLYYLPGEFVRGELPRGDDQNDFLVIEQINNVSQLQKLKLSAEHYKQLNAQFGPLTHLYFRDVEYTVDWIGKNYYGLLFQNNSGIYRTLQKALEDYMKSPTSTSYVFVLPYFPQSSWFKHFAKYFESIAQFPGRTEIFEISDNSISTTTASNPLVLGNPGDPFHSSIKSQASSSLKNFCNYNGEFKNHLQNPRIGFPAKLQAFFDFTENPSAGKDFSGVSDSEFNSGLNAKSNPTDSGIRKASCDWPIVVWFKDWTVSTHVDTLILAHLRFGHASKFKLQKLVDSGVNTGICFTCDGSIFCTCCRTARAVRPSFKSSNKRKVVEHAPPRTSSTYVGQLVFTDIIVMPESDDGHSYIVCFTDDTSRFTKVYFLKLKSDAVDAFQDYCSWLSKTVDKTCPDRRFHVESVVIRAVQSDQGGEYMGDFSAFCDQHNIAQRFSAAYAHENAAIAERYNETIQSVARALMCTAQFPRRKWPLAFRHAAHIITVLPHEHHRNLMSPFESIMGFKPDLSKFYVFGCLAFAFIDENVRDNKLSDRAKQFIYVGLDYDSPSFLLLDLTTNKVEKKGMVKCIENLDDYGKLLSRPVEGLKYNFTIPVNVPEPFDTNDIYDKDVMQILDLQIYYDSDDEETYGIIKIKTSAHPSGLWMKASAFMQSINNDTARYQMVKSYISKIKNTELQIMYYPIFAIVQVKYGHFRAHKCEAIIVSYDRSQTSTYGVIHYDGYFQDHKHTEVNFDSVLESSATFLSGILSCDNEEGDKFHSYVLSEFSNAVYSVSDVIDNSLIESIVNKLSTKWLDYKEPLTIKEALQRPDSEKWQEAINLEFHNLENVLKVLELVNEIPVGVKPIPTKFVFKLKVDSATGELDKYRARCVVKGFNELYGIHYTENYSPTPQIVTQRIIIVLCLYYNLDKHHLDVSSAFMNSFLKEVIYIELPEGIDINGCKFARLLKSLYGLKQAARDWYELSDRIIKTFDKNIKQSVTDPCFYFLFTDTVIFVLSVHVDDYFVGCNCDKYYANFIAHFKSHVTVTDKGKPQNLLQMSVEWHEDCVTLSQELQIIKLAQTYQIVGDKQSDTTPMEKGLKLTGGDKNNLPNVPYRELIGALFYIARMTRADILWVVCVLSRFTHCYTTELFRYALRVLRYLFKTKSLKLTFKIDPNAPPVEMFVDSSLGDPECSYADGRSTCGNVVFMYGCAVGWNCEKHDDVSLSSTDAEYKTLTYGFRDGLYFVNLLQRELQFPITPIPVKIDNLGAGFRAEQKMNNKRNKHVHLRYHFCRELIEQNIFELDHIHTALNPADIFTKALVGPLLRKLRMMILKCDEVDVD